MSILLEEEISTDVYVDPTLCNNFFRCRRKKYIYLHLNDTFIMQLHNCVLFIREAIGFSYQVSR